MINYYQTLGVDRDATPDQIKRAYRKLASQHHPDKGGDKNKFQEIEEAYRTLGDPQKRSEYNNPRPNAHNFGFHHQAGPGGFDFQTIFDVFGARFQQPQQRTQRAQMTLWITLQDVAHAAQKTISVGTPQGTQVIEIDIPANINDGDSVQYSGLGPGGIDLIINYRIHPNPKWQRQGPNLTIDQEISVWDLILGGDIVIQDILGNQLTLTIPPRTQAKTTFRLKGRGLGQKGNAPGDMFVRVHGTIPAHIPEPLLDAIAQTRNQ
jgi:DnaJ-class molecular chaperone